jgi:hypothetical protein
VLVESTHRNRTNRKTKKHGYYSFPRRLSCHVLHITSLLQTIVELVNFFFPFFFPPPRSELVEMEAYWGVSSSFICKRRPHNYNSITILIEKVTFERPATYMSLTTKKLHFLNLFVHTF